ncbi:MAG TPA: N-acetylmuramoyl-L-alanine amidase [Microthrixaceae bacterium]|nr:N-acetylmuramoyl-L-alanine amidase [Microthrixaceae bacterium]HMT63104.1 N-acetylmuramoyl-L-alanine amidase [Microthrixaceae bacterium]
MCESCNAFEGLTRRSLLAGVVGGAAGLLVAKPVLAQPALLAQLPTVTVAPGLDIVTRDGWAENRPPRGKIGVETDVRFLLVHHTAEPGNDYGPGEAPGLLRGMYDFHTSAAKGWPDIAYNFLIDQFGVVYEGRFGSLTQASIPDATGGSQGFSQLACFIGDLNVQAPTDAARDSMDRVLAYLAERHGVDITPGTTTDFISRGSNRFGPGAPVHTKTVAGHRDMSTTTCPGDFAYVMVEDNSFAARASAIRQASAITTTTTAATTTSMTMVPMTPPTLATVPTAADRVATPSVGGVLPPVATYGKNNGPSVPLLAAGAALVVGGAAAVPLIRRWSRKRVNVRPVSATGSTSSAPTPIPTTEASHPTSPVVALREPLPPSPSPAPRPLTQTRIIRPTDAPPVEFRAQLGGDLGAGLSMRTLTGVAGVGVLVAPNRLLLADPDFQRFLDTAWDDSKAAANEWQRTLLAVEERNGITSPLIDGVVATRPTVVVRRTGQCWLVVDDDRGPRSARPGRDAKPLVARFDPEVTMAVVVAAGNTPPSAVRAALLGAQPSPGVAVLHRAGWTGSQGKPS